MKDARQEFSRIYEILDGIVKTNPRREYAQNFEKSIAENLVAQKHFRHIEADLAELDRNAWLHIKSEVLGRFKWKHPVRGWQLAFDILNEAKAYNYLLKLGCSDIEFIPVSSTRTPDLLAKLRAARVLCEVKTINCSNAEVTARQGQSVHDGKQDLPSTFFQKLESTVSNAATQISNYDPGADALWIIYVVLNFDDSLNEYVTRYLKQIHDYVLTRSRWSGDIVFDTKPAFYAATWDSPAADLHVYTKGGIWRRP